MGQPLRPAYAGTRRLVQSDQLQAAEARVRAAFSLQEEARLAKLPSFSLSATAGYTSLTDFIGQLTAGIVAPLYTGGALEGQLEVATADQNAAIAAYAQSVLTSFMEVENALASEQTCTSLWAGVSKSQEYRSRKS